MMNLAKDMIMRIKPQDFKFDVLTVAGYANPKAKTHFAPSASGFNFKWEWEGKIYELHIEQEKLQYPDFILERLLMPQLRWLKMTKITGWVFVYRYSHIALASRTENLVMARGYVSKNLFNRIFCLQI